MLYIHLFLANLIWGLNVIVTKLNYDSFHPLFLAMLKILFSVLALLFYIYYKKISFEKVSIKKLIVQTNLINVINFLLTYYGMQYVEGTMTATINCLAPVMMFIVSVSLCKWNWKILISFMISFLGFLIAIHFRLFNIGKGIFFLITALFIYNFGNYRLKDITHNTFIYNLYMLLIAFFEFIVSVSLCKWNWKILISFMISFLGFLIAIHFRLFNIGKGIFFLITALFIYNFGNYRLKDITHNTFIYNLYMLLIAFFEFIVILLFQKNDLFKTVNTFSLWLFILTSGIGYAYIQCVYFLSIHSIGPLKTSFFMAFSPAFTYFFSLILLKEKFDFFVLIGFIVIFTASFYFISKKEN